MRRDRMLQTAMAGSVAGMTNWRYIALHAAGAAAFIFMLQRCAMNAPLDSSVLWALTFGGCAAGLAYVQSSR
jgi:Na+-transporting NADH:ubiquinone oxidoreductase subunit NqrB